jgi:hypothetical protein
VKPCDRRAGGREGKEADGGARAVHARQRRLAQKRWIFSHAFSSNSFEVA